MVLTKSLPARVYTDLETARRIMNWEMPRFIYRGMLILWNKKDFPGVREIIIANMEIL